MVALGDLEPVDVAIHADTTHEASGTYSFAERWTPWLEERGVRVVTVISKQAQPIQMVTTQWTDIPAFTTVPDNPKGGQLRRQCTGSWKVNGLRQWLQANRNGQRIEQWLGISLDEFQRMKDSDVKYITHRWPLIERRMTRWDCQRYLETNGLEVPPKSACVFCPYHNQAAWRELKAEGGADWQKAVEVDEAIRKVRPPYDLFIHPARIPLTDIDLRSEQDKGQLSLWDAECSGICGV
jgi:sarcosine oxidase delta subunit